MTIIKELETYFCDVLLRTNTKYVSMKYIVSQINTTSHKIALTLFFLGNILRIYT